MRLLLDTHTFLWFISGSTKLSRPARELIENPNNERLLSIASLWEMSIKVSMGRLKVGLPFTELVERDVIGNAIQVLRVVPEHLDKLAKLPFYHRDPFDRLIIAQGLADGLPVVSKDRVFQSYPVRLFW